MFLFINLIIYFENNTATVASIHAENNNTTMFRLIENSKIMFVCINFFINYQLIQYYKKRKTTK